MACYHPLTAWYSKDINPSGKRSLVFSAKNALQPDDPLEIACGQCIGCRLERSRQWAIRCLHEAQTWDSNCFITLTFSPAALNERQVPDSLDIRDFQKFMKRLRKKFGAGIRYFHCGEYGEHYARPHYHACLFNFDFPDKEPWKVVNGNTLYISPTLAELWPYGFSTIGDVTFESAAYVARYIMKKVTGEPAAEHYGDRKPEYTSMSRRPGIGSTWFDQFKSDVYPSDFIVLNGRKMRTPKYYDKLLDQLDPVELDYIKEHRLAEGARWSENNTPERLAVREQVQKLRLERLQRNHDEESE